MKPNSRKKTTTTGSPVLSGIDPATLHDKISKKAYEIFQSRGGQHGRHHEDWLEAERLVCSQLEPVSELGPKPAARRPARVTTTRRPMPER
jgi:hypothetical protein